MGVCDWVFFLPTWLYVLLFVAAALYIYGVWPYKTTKIPYPGPKPLPFIGNMMDIFRVGVQEADRENVKKYGPVYLNWLARTPELMISDPDMVKEIFIKQFPNFVNRTVVRGTVSLSKIESQQLTILEDDHWKFVRATLTPAFSSGRLREMVPILQGCLNNLQDVIFEGSKEGKSVEMKKIFQNFTMDAIATTAFGIDTNLQKNSDDPFAKLLETMFQKRISFLMFLNMMFPPLTWIMEYFEISAMPKETRDAMDAIIQNIRSNISERKEKNIKRRDLLQLMMDAQIDDLDPSAIDTKVLENDIQKQRKGLTETEIMAQSVVFLLAGYATTAGTLGMLAHSLAVNPDCQEKLIEEIDRELKNENPTYENVMNLQYLDMCLSEVLRIYPPAQRLTRHTKEDIVIKGHLIPKNTIANFPISHFHTNPEWWPEPEKFKPERFTPEEKANRHPYVYLPFGAGPRNCVGMRLAQLETKMAIVAILQKFRFVRSVDTEVPLKLALTGLSETVNGIWLKMESRRDN
ncbi:cytochrome P450 3A9-like [Liolophura sinensis]|uniref:cytochrome P450 3A9-like n=1 Tax=Liolophura sinensis TaxID=3198878 RepID=UPI0031581635